MKLDNLLFSKFHTANKLHALIYEGTTNDSVNKGDKYVKNV